MPEADTVWRTARRLHQVFAGEVLTGCDLRWPSVAEYDFTGARTVEVVARGKHLLHRVRSDGGTDWTIHSHLRMDGSWIIEPPGHRPSGHRVRAVLATARYVAVGHDLGMLDVVHTAEEHQLVGHLGPDLLGIDWDPQRAAENLHRNAAPISAALLDQRNLAGIGTIWASESLFAERLDPWVMATDLTEPQLLRLVTRAQRLVDGAKDRPIPSSTGETRPGRNTYVHSRERRPCRRCGTAIRKARTGPATRERPIWFCPRCQGSAGPPG